MVPFELVYGHIHQAMSVSGTVATVWPTPWPGWWHVSIKGYPPRATQAPVPAERVRGLLEEWGFRPGDGWRHWPGPLHEVNPALDRSGGPP